MSSRLRGGHVVSIRLNPKDCISVLDIIEAVGMKAEGMSFAAQVSLALSSLIQTARNQKFIPDPDGFDYLVRMQPYINGKNNKRKLAVTRVISEAGAKVAPQGLAAPVRNEVVYEPTVSPVQIMRNEPKPDPTVERELRQELSSLLKKKELVDQNVQGVSWSTADDIRYTELYKHIYGE